MTRTTRWILAALLPLAVACAAACGGGDGDGDGGADSGEAVDAAASDAAGGDSSGPAACLSGAPGDILYAFPSGGEIRGTPAVGPDGTVYFATMEFGVHAVDCRGEERWSWSWECPGEGGFQCSHAFTASLALAGDTVFNGDVLLALTTAGALAWESPASATAGSLDAAPALAADGSLFVGSRALGAGGSVGKLFGLEPGGAVRAGFPIDLGGAVESAPVVVGDTVYVAQAWRATSSSNQYTLVVRAIGADGAEKWSQTLAEADGFPHGTTVPSSLAVDGAGRILVVVSRVPTATGQTQSQLLRLNRETGQVVAETRLTAADCVGACAPIVRGVGTDEEVFVVSSWQGLVDRARPGAADSDLFVDPNFPGCRDCRTPSPAVGDDGLLYVVGGATDAMTAGAPPLALLAYDEDENGRQVLAAEYPFMGKDEADNVSTSVQIGPGGVAYVGTRGGVIVAIQTGAGGLDPNAPWPGVRHDAANTGRVDR